MSRFEVCSVLKFDEEIFQVEPPSPVPVGHLIGSVYDDFVLQKTKLTYADNITVHFDDISPQVAGMFTMTHTAKCVAVGGRTTATCTAQSNFPDGTVPSMSSDVNTSVTVVDSIPATGNGVTDNSLELTLSFVPRNPQVLKSAALDYTPAIDASCDNQISRLNPGCALPQFWPTLTTMTQLPYIAGNIKRIQDGSTSHPGVAGFGPVRNNWGNPNGLPLHRSEANKAANNAAACPKSRPNPNPDFLECDEYPFASSDEGASLPGIPDTEWGWAWVPKDEQRSQGGLLGGAGGFYDNNRLLEEDAHWVDVSGATEPPPIIGPVQITGGVSNGGTYRSTVAVTASAPPADAFYFHVQQGGTDVLVSPSIAGTPGTNNHTWNFDTTALSNGDYQLFGVATLGGSVVGLSPTISIKVANPPKVTIDSGLVNGGTYGGATVPVTGTATPAADAFYFHFQQGGADKLVSPAVAGTPGTPHHTWQFDPTVLPNGTYQVFAAATLGGVVGQSATITITVGNWPVGQGGSWLTAAPGGFQVAWQGRDPNSSLWLGNGSGTSLGAKDDPFLLGVAYGTKPSIATLSDGSWVAAWQGRDANNSLWIATGKGSTITAKDDPWLLGVAYGTSPSIVALPGNRWEVAWQGRDANNSLWLATGTGTTITAKDDPWYLGVAYGTSPSLAALPNGGFQVAWQGRDANNSLWLATGTGTTITAKDDPWYLGVAYGTSPSIATLSDGSWVAAWQGRDANNSLWLATGTGATMTAKDDPWLLGVDGGSSPTITGLPGNKWMAAWQGRDANNSLWLATGSGTTIDAKDDPWYLGMAGMRTIVTDGTAYHPGFTWTGLKTKLVFQNDGNLVEYRLSDGAALWASNTAGHPNATLSAQTDGNIVIYDGPAIWATGTDHHPGDRLTVRDDGNVVINDANSGPQLWATGT